MYLYKGITTLGLILPLISGIKHMQHDPVITAT